MAEIIIATQQALSANSAIVLLQLIGGGIVSALIYFLVAWWTNS